MMSLDKFFSEQKILSRKEVADKVKKGCITVNGVVAKKQTSKLTKTKISSHLMARLYHTKSIYT